MTRTCAVSLKSFIVLLMMAWAVILVSPPSARATETLLWSDEFSASPVDNSIWTYDVGGSGFGNNELEFYTSRPDNAHTDSGDLVITARREQYLDKTQAFTS